MVNAEDAVARAKEAGVDWILHLDIDELFFAGGFSPDSEGGAELSPSIHFHFYELSQADFTTSVYLNYEAVPTAVESDFFIATIGPNAKPCCSELTRNLFSIFRLLFGNG